MQRGSPRTQGSILGSEVHWLLPEARALAALGVIPRATFLNKALALNLLFHPLVARGTSSFLPGAVLPVLEAVFTVISVQPPPISRSEQRNPTAGPWLPSRGPPNSFLARVLLFYLQTSSNLCALQQAPMPITTTMPPPLAHTPVPHHTPHRSQSCPWEGGGSHTHW